MKIDLNENERKDIIYAMQTHMQAQKRAYNTEANEKIKTIRQEAMQQFAALQSKIQNMTEALK